MSAWPVRTASAARARIDSTRADRSSPAWLIPPPGTCSRDGVSVTDGVCQRAGSVGEDDAAVVVELPVRVVGDLPQMAVGIVEGPDVAPPPLRLARADRGGAGLPRGIERSVDLAAAGDVDGGRHPAEAGRRRGHLVDAGICSERRVTEGGAGTAAGVEEADVALDRRRRHPPAERPVEARGRRQVADA